MWVEHTRAGSFPGRTDPMWEELRAALARRRWWFRWTGALTVILVLAAGCSDDDGAGGNAASGPGSETDEVPAPTAPPETTTTTPPGEFDVAGTWEWVYEDTTGYRTAGTLEVGSVHRAADAPSLPGIEDPAGTLPSWCDAFDPLSDALIPARVTLRNDTESFPMSLANNFHLATTETGGAMIRTASDELLGVAAAYSDGITCKPMVTADEAFFSQGSGWSIKWDDPAPPGEARGPHYAMLILPGYFTPNTPDGDVGRLATVGLALVPAMRNDDASLVELTGPDSQLSETAGALLLTVLS